MPGIDIIRSLFQQANAQGSRSTVLNPLGWALAIVLAGFATDLKLQAPTWISVLFAIFSALILLVYLFTYIYFVFTNSDALRSEKFTLSKMAIERSITGDSLRGFAQIGIDAPEILPAAEPTPEKLPQ